jgi:hypothetical protein
MSRYNMLIELLCKETPDSSDITESLLAISYKINICNGL